MKNTIYKKSALIGLRVFIIPCTVSAALLALTWMGINRAEQGSHAESRRLLEDSLRRAVAACFAAESRYPVSVAYMEAYYGVYVDHARYAVHYEIFASNIMPEVTVIEK